MRLELNLPALERLIGGDTELELELRKQIIQEFAKRHLKEEADKAAYEAVVEEVRRRVNELAKNNFGIDNLVTSLIWPTVDFRLKSMIESLVNEQARKAVDAALLQIIECQKRYWKHEIEAAVKRGMDRQIEKEIEEGIRKRLEAAAKGLST
jgi:hypothetical protein